MVRLKKFQCAIAVSFIFLCGACELNAQIWFGSDSKTNDSSSSQPVQEAHRTADRK